MKVVPLGTNGFFSSHNRQTASYAIPLGKILIILDVGSGIFRLAESEGKKLLLGVNDVHIYLSHYHLDHTYGFYAAFTIFKDKKVTVFAKDTRRVFSDLSKEYFPNNYDVIHNNFSWKKLNIGENKIADYKVRVRNQYHNGNGSLAFRFCFANKKEIAYVTDSEPSEEGIEFVKEVDILFHEHYLTGDEILKKEKVKIEDHFSGKHVTTVGAATIAKEARVGKLALIHNFPFYDDKRLQRQLKIARSIFPKTQLSIDLKGIEF